MKKVSLKKGILIFVVIVIIIAICFLVANRQRNDEVTPSGGSYSEDDNFNEQEEWLATVNGNIELSEKETLGESITVTVSLDKDENIDSVALYALQGGISEIEATKIDDGVYEAEISFEAVNAEEGYYQFKAILEDYNGNEKEIISEDTVNYFKTGVSYALAYQKEDGRTAVQITALDKGEVLVSTTNIAPTADDARWTKYKAGEEYIIATPEENVENVYVWYKNGENIINATDSGISVMSTEDCVGMLAPDFAQKISGITYQLYFSKITKKYSLDVSILQDGSVMAYSDQPFERSLERMVYIYNTKGEKVKAPIDSSYLFHNLGNSSKDLLNIYNIDNLDVSMVENMSHMFTYLGHIEGLGGWNTSNVTDMSYMFYYCSGLTSIEGLGSWNTSNVTDMSRMFIGCSSLTNIENLDNWNTSNVTDMSGMFISCSSLTNIENLDNWNTNSVTDMSYMYSGCSGLTNIDALSSWKTDSVTDMNHMFNYCKNLTSIDALSNWKTDSVTDMNHMFNKCQELTSTEGIGNWNTSGVTNMNYMFAECDSLTDVESLRGLETDSVTDMSYMFYYCSGLTSIESLGSWNTSSVTDMKSMFSSCSSLTNIDALGDWNTSSVTDMNSMFDYCESLTNIDALKDWNTGSVTDMNSMFYRCSSLTNIDALGDWNTSSVTNMGAMFGYCGNLTSIEILNNWNTSSVTNMKLMFGSCKKLTNIALSDWNVSNVTGTSNMFEYCTELIAVNLGKWDASKLETSSKMFFKCDKLKYLILGDKFKLIESGVSTSLDEYYFVSSNEASVLSLSIESLTFKLPDMYRGGSKKCLGNLYVKNSDTTPSIESIFESADTGNMFGTERIREVIELIGDSTITVTIPNKYMDPGVKVAGYPPEDLEEFPQLGLTFEVDKSAVDNAIKNKTTGEYTVTYTLKYNNEVFSTATRKVIVKSALKIPTLSGNYVYTGTEQTVILNDFDPEVMIVTGNKKTDAGSYEAIVTLKDPSSDLWEDGTNTAKTINWKIEPKEITSNMITLEYSTASYVGSALQPGVTVKDGDKVLTPGVDYDVRYENNTEVGTAKVVITGKGNYEGTIEKEFTIQDTTPPTPPTITAKLNQASGENYGSGTWTNQNVHVSLQSTDYSDIQKYQYREGTTGEWKDMPAGGVKLYDTEMNQDLYYRAVDKYGNTSEASSLSVRIDKTPPEKGTLKANIRDEHGLEYEFGKVTDKSVYLRLDYLGSDRGGSGLKNTTYILEEVDDNQRDHVLRTLATNETGARTLKESGTYRVVVVTEDGAGNITRSDPYYIIIDRDFTNVIRLNNLYDVGSGIKDIMITITKEGESEPTYTETISIYEANFVKRVKLPEGVFDVNVVIQDKAGNSKTLTGKINNVIW